MRTMAVLLLAGVAACQAGDGLDPGAYEETQPALHCGTAEPSEGAKLAIELDTSGLPHADDPVARGGTIDVYVHVIRKGLGIENGDVPDAAIHAQLAVLDAAFAEAGWRFRLAAIDRTTHLGWYQMTPGSAAETAAKTALRRGTARDLNLYLAEPGHGFLGYATFPSQYRVAPHHDGVVMLHSVLPGGASAPYHLGDQTVHEVGHWLGLYHTFQTECGGNGDYVADTAATSAPAYGCPMGRDTCGDDREDPVRNYMDAADDACMNAFTPGQIARMDAQFNAYRRY